MTQEDDHIFCFEKYPELTELVRLIKVEIDQMQRPAHEVILDDADLRALLKVSKRTTSKYRATGMIAYHLLGGKVFYTLEDVMEALRKNRIPAGK